MMQDGPARHSRPRQTAELDTIFCMDKKLAQKNIRAGLICGALCFFMFGATFIVGAIYLHS